MSLDNELNLWRNTIGYGAGAMPRIGYLDRCQNLRLERIRLCRMLYRGDHEQFYLTERRTRHNFPAIEVQGVTQQLYQSYNLLRLITMKSADLLLGERPGINSDDPNQQDAIDELVKRTKLHKVLYTAVKEASWAAEATVEVLRWDGDVYVQNLPPGEVYPIGQLQPDGQHEAYCRYAIENVGTDMAPKLLLLETTYTAGKITRQCFSLKDGTQKGDVVPLSAWPVPGLRESEETGLDDNTIIWLANEDEEGQPVSDYDGLIAAQDLVNAKRTQIARVLAKHADPKLGMPAETARGDGNVPASHSVFYFRSKDEIPQYIVWNAELTAADTDFMRAVHELCIQAEMSEVLLGISDEAIPQTAAGLRLQATNSVSKAKRKGINVAPFIERIVDVAQDMEDQRRVISVAVAPVGVEMRDGLPVDDFTQAQTINLLTGGKPTMSVERAVAIQVPDPEAQAKELARLAAAQAAATAPILLQTEDPAQPAGTPVPPEESPADQVQNIVNAQEGYGPAVAA